MTDKYIIIPGCSDLNRGDQALVWESIRLFEECGKHGKFMLMSEKNEPVKQSLEHGLGVVTPVLEHPSRKFKNKNNLEYTKWLKVKWGIVAVGDLLRSILLLNKFTRCFGKALLSNDEKKSYEEFNSCKGIIVKGGGFIHAYGGLTATYYIYFSLFHIFLGQRLGKPVYVMPNSIGPFEGPLVKWMVRKALKRGAVVLTRETTSQKMIEEQLDLHVESTPDLAFYLENGVVDKEQFFEKYGISKERKLVAMTMRPHRFPKSSTPAEDYVRYKKSLATFAKWLYDNGYMPVLIEHVLAVNYNESDWECIKEVEQYLSKDEYVVVSNREYTCYQLKRIYSFFDYIIGTRFHSIIFSMANGVPGIAITYTGNKGQGIMHDMGLDDYCISIDNVTEATLRQKFQSLLKSEDTVKGRIAEYLNSATGKREKIKQLIRNEKSKD